MVSSGIMLSQFFTTFISHFFDIDSFISRSWITVVNPEKRTDFHFISRFYKSFTALSSQKSNFSRTEFAFGFVSEI